MKLVGDETDMRTLSRNTIRFVICVAMAVGVTSTRPAGAEKFPSRPIKIIVPLAAGGMADIIARIVAQGLTQASKQPVIVENKPGGAGEVGAHLAAGAPRRIHFVHGLSRGDRNSPISEGKEFDSFRQRNASDHTSRGNSECSCC